jgi:hypothetical protein
LAEAFLGKTSVSWLSYRKTCYANCPRLTHRAFGDAMGLARPCKNFAPAQALGRLVSHGDVRAPLWTNLNGKQEEARVRRRNRDLSSRWMGTIWQAWVLRDQLISWRCRFRIGAESDSYFLIAVPLRTLDFGP